MTHTADDVRRRAGWEDHAALGQLPMTAEYHRENAAMLRAYAALLEKPKMTREGLAETISIAYEENMDKGRLHAHMRSAEDRGRSFKTHWLFMADALISAGVAVADSK